MAKIVLNKLEFYAYHGHFKEEQKVGNKFIVDLTIVTDIRQAAKTDNLEDALDYTQVYNVISETMKQKCYLIETVLMNIVRNLFAKFYQIQHLEISLKKLNPPLGGKVESVGVVWEGGRNDL